MIFEPLQILGLRVGAVLGGIDQGHVGDGRRPLLACSGRGVGDKVPSVACRREGEVPEADSVPFHRILFLVQTLFHPLPNRPPFAAQGLPFAPGYLDDIAVRGVEFLGRRLVKAVAPVGLDDSC